MPPSRKIIFVTGNARKLAEVQAILGNSVAGIELESKSLDIVEIQGTIEEITRDKCQRAAEVLKGPVLVEDSALCFKALNGLPGAYVKWFLKEIGNDGLNNLLAAYEDKSAEAVCTFGYCLGPGHDVIFFQGRAQGKIVPARGPPKFGWDPIFEYEGKTFAEMENSEKNKISHRGKALQKLSEWMAEHKDQ